MFSDYLFTRSIEFIIILPVCYINQFHLFETPAPGAHRVGEHDNATESDIHCKYCFLRLVGGASVYQFSGAATRSAVLSPGVIVWRMHLGGVF